MRRTKAQLQAERDYLFEHLVLQDAHRMCDRSNEISFRDQLPRSRKYIEGLLNDFNARNAAPKE